MSWHQGESTPPFSLNCSSGKICIYQCYRTACEKIVTGVLFCGCYFVSVLVVVVARVLDVVTPRMGVGVLALLVVI